MLDLIIKSREILTMNPAHPTAYAVGVIGERIVGLDEDLEGQEATETWDFGDASITPGLIDAHCHTPWWGLSLSAVDLSSARGLPDVYRSLRQEVDRLNKAGDSDTWVHATGFNETHHEGSFPLLAELDEISGDRPLYIRHASGHSTITNSATLRLAGIFDSAVDEPVGGVIVREADGRPTGVLEETAQSLVQALLLPHSTADLVNAIDVATSRFASEGITSFTEAGVGGGWIGHSPIEIAAYQLAKDSGRLHARAQLMPASDSLHAISGHSLDHHGEPYARGLDLGVRFGFGDSMLSVGHVKIFVDGSLLGATAAVTESFCGHKHNTGYLLQEPGTQLEDALAAYRAGWPLALHAIGDAAIDLSLDIIDEAQRRYGRLAAPCRIEHFGISRPDQVDRAGKLQVAVTPQAGFIGPLGDQIAGLVGEERNSYLYRGRSIIDAGAILAGSSDLPVADNNLRRGMQSAIDRLTASGVRIAPLESISPIEALRTHTSWAAEACGQEAHKGTIERGKLADFTVFSESPIHAERVDAIEIVATIVGGTRTYGFQK